MKKLTLILLLLVAAAPCTFRSQAQERPWMKYITPSGYYQAGYSIDDALNNTFYIKRARIALAGELINSERYGKVEYKVQAELAGSPKLMDYFVRYTVRPEFGIIFGQTKTPLTVENSEYAPLKLELIDYSLVVQRFARMSANDLYLKASSGGREMGIQFFGNWFKMNDGHALVRYQVGLFNGNGINKNDDDRLKNFMARVMIFPIKDLSISGCYERRLGHMDEVEIYNDYDYRILDRYGAAIAYDSKFAWFRTEYMAGHTFGWRAEGAYVTAGYKITPTWNVGARYDYFTTNSREVGHDQQYITIGTSWHPFPRLRLQLNYTHKQEPDRSVTHLVNVMSSIIL
ncbi:MAG: hypothetical protein II112_05265 [Bacteroidales bacterium]|nr:hypothetical protein [Bacteroidales bacterium]MBQ1831764.1 hypothetical protein [Bacteroidales bacterium]